MSTDLGLAKSTTSTVPTHDNGSMPILRNKSTMSQYIMMSSGILLCKRIRGPEVHIMPSCLVVVIWLRVLLGKIFVAVWFRVLPSGLLVSHLLSKSHDESLIASFGSSGHSMADMHTHWQSQVDANTTKLPHSAWSAIAGHQGFITEFGLCDMHTKMTWMGMHIDGCVLDVCERSTMMWQEPLVLNTSKHQSGCVVNSSVLLVAFGMIDDPIWWEPQQKLMAGGMGHCNTGGHKWCAKGHQVGDKSMLVDRDTIATTTTFTTTLATTCNHSYNCNRCCPSGLPIFYGGQPRCTFSASTPF